MSNDPTNPPAVTLVIATRNAHKVTEIRAILGEQFDYRTLNDVPGAPKVVEDANSFAGNATKKAVELGEWLAQGNRLGADRGRQVFALADDSGLEVDALNGAPGVHSARFALLDQGTAPARSSGNAVDSANNAKLLRLLENVPLEQRRARFRCVLALTAVAAEAPESMSQVCYASESELSTQLFEGACEGRIGFAPKGHNGFGYDPLFVPLGYEKSFAELGEEIKNRMSHRARALEKLKGWFQKS